MAEYSETISTLEDNFQINCTFKKPENALEIVEKYAEAIGFALKFSYFKKTHNYYRITCSRGGENWRQRKKRKLGEDDDEVAVVSPKRNRITLKCSCTFSVLFRVCYSKCYLVK